MFKTAKLREWSALVEDTERDHYAKFMNKTYNVLTYFAESPNF